LRTFSDRHWWEGFFGSKMTKDHLWSIGEANI
jgi:hypothetical protein